MRRLAAGMLAASLTLAACGGATGGADSLLATIANHPAAIGTGFQRIMFGLVNQSTGEFVESQFLDAVVTLRDENGAPLDTRKADFMWIVPNVRGLYVLQLEFPEPGLYQLTINVGDGEVGPIGIQALADPVVVSKGEVAPLSATRTSADHDIAEISSDPEPDPDFYTQSVADAIASGPTVIVFATPRWCRSAACGPLLSQVKELAPAFPQLNFVHVEVYENVQAASFDELILVPAIEEWGLPTEPWVFVVNGDGIVTAALEGAASGEELVASFNAVLP